MHPHTAGLAETLADPRVGAREMILGMEHPTAPDATATDTLLLHRDGPVATLTINRPDRLNAVTFAMFSRLPALLSEAEAMAGVIANRAPDEAKRRSQARARAQPPP